MKFSKRLITMLLITLMLIGTVFILPLTASAADTDIAETGTQSRDYNFSKNYNLTGNGAADIVAIARAQIGKTKANLGYTEAWCADFVSDCAKLAGQGGAVPFNGGVAYMYNAVMNAGGQKVSTPQAGDLVFYFCTTDNYWCHVAVMTDSVNSIHGNVGPSVTSIKYSYYLDGYYQTATGGTCYTVTFVRPNYKGSAAVFGTPTNLGDGFFASLAKSDSGVYLANINGNVELANHETIYDNSHIWKFSRQSDNSYVLTNCASGAVMDVANAGTTEGTNIGMCPLNNGDAQKWYFYKQSDGSYVVRPKYCQLVMDVKGAYNDFGTNVQIWTYNQSTAQKFSLIMQPVVNAPELSVEPGDYKTLTTFKCKIDVKPLSYDLIIKSVNGDKVTDYKTINMVQNDVFMYELPEGTYQAYARVSNGYSSAQSNKVTFEVSGKPVVGEDGWTYSDKLYSDVTFANYEIQYLHTYSKVASESPGAGWTKGEFVKKEYVNSGGSYWSDIELSTSDTRVVVNYIYYHYCGGSTGNDANFTQAGNFNHYDWLPKDGVKEHSSHADYDDSRYKFYHLKWSDGSDSYCKSGVSCDGSFGSHGNRSCYWYKRTQYQDRVAVDLYEYTKPSVWVSVHDSSADSVTYRYRLRTGGVFGDANGDGKVTVADATTIQKYCASLVNFSDNTKSLADVDRNGRITVSDATKIQKFIAGIISSL